MEVNRDVQPRKQKLKFRKPAAEKRRRDRINGSIERLKALLRDQLGSQRPNSRLEKADILETAVAHLKTGAWGRSYTDGFARCLEETSRFLSATSQLTAESPGAQTAKTRSREERSSSSAPKCALDSTQLWRPW